MSDIIHLPGEGVSSFLTNLLIFNNDVNDYVQHLADIENMEGVSTPPSVAWEYPAYVRQQYAHLQSSFNFLLELGNNTNARVFNDNICYIGKVNKLILMFFPDIVEVIDELNKIITADKFLMSLFKIPGRVKRQLRSIEVNGLTYVVNNVT